MKKIILLFCGILSFITLNSQDLNVRAVIKNNDGSKKTYDKLKEVTEVANTITLNDGNESMSFKFEKGEAYCGLSQERTKNYNLILLNGKNSSLFSFLDKFKCVLESSEQFQNNHDPWSFKDAGLWSMLFFIEESHNTIGFVRTIPDGIREMLPEIKNLYHIEKYTVRSDTVYRKIYKTEEDLKQGNKKDIGKAYLLINNNIITDLTKNKTLCEFTGTNNFEIALLWFALQFKTHDMAIAEKGLRKLGEMKYDENQAKLRAKFLKETKKCYYCNKSYTGESFDYGPFRSYKKELGPCSAKVEVVYKPRFCSRECAIHNCKNGK
jgi:hypothetical protein